MPFQALHRFAPAKCICSICIPDPRSSNTSNSNSRRPASALFAPSSTALQNSQKSNTPSLNGVQQKQAVGSYHNQLKKWISCVHGGPEPPPHLSFIMLRDLRDSWFNVLVLLCAAFPTGLERDSLPTSEKECLVPPVICVRAPSCGGSSS